MNHLPCKMCKRTTRISSCRQCGHGPITKPLYTTNTKDGMLCRSCYSLVYEDKLDYDSMYAIHRYGNRY